MDEALAQLTREWLTKALHDLQTARITANAAAEILTPYVSAFRYPGLTDDPMPSREEFDAALQQAQAIYDFVLNLVPTAARP